MGRGVRLRHLPDGFFYREQPACVIGGGNTAVLKRCTVQYRCQQGQIPVHRRDKFGMPNPSHDKPMDKVKED